MIATRSLNVAITSGIIPRRLDDRHPVLERRHHLRIAEQIHVPLPVSHLHVLQAVPFARRRRHRLTQHRQLLRPDRNLTRLGLTQHPLRPDDVAQIQQLRRIPGFPQELLTQPQLDRPRPVPNRQKNQLADIPMQHDTSRSTHHLLLVLRVIFLPNRRQLLRPIVPTSVRIHTQLRQFPRLLPPRLLVFTNLFDFFRIHRLPILALNPHQSTKNIRSRYVLI